jgi:hypothetical protein
LVWFTQGSPQLSVRAGEALREAEASDGIVVSVVLRLQKGQLGRGRREIANQLVSADVREAAQLGQLLGRNHIPARHLHPTL